MGPRHLLPALALAAALAGCSAGAPEPLDDPSVADAPRPTTPADPLDRPSPRPTSGPTSDRPPGPGPATSDGTLPEAAYGPGSRPPSWLFSRPLPEAANGYGEVQPTPASLQRRAFTLPDQVPMLPGRGYASRIVSPAPAAVVDRSTWEPGCPVARDELAWLRLTFHGFDARRHTGELLVNTAVVDDLDQVFSRLYAARFPLEQVLIVRSIDEEAAPTGDGNGTGGFVCRAVTGGAAYSQHAYGLAIDVNAFQNPYARDEVVLPELASSYLDRARVRPGMVTADGPVVAAFAEIGWEWGGAWSSLVDYQHFSANGR